MTIEQQCFCCGKDFHEGAAQIMVDVDQDNGDVVVCVPCFVTHCCDGNFFEEQECGNAIQS